MAIEGVTYGKRRKVTNSIIAQSEIRKISTGRTLRVVVPVAKGQGLAERLREAVQGHGAARCSKVRSAERQDSGHCTARTAQQSAVAPALAGKPVLLYARCEAGKGGCRMAKLQAKDVKGAVGLRMRQKKMQHECHMFQLIAGIDCCLSVVRRNERGQP